MADIAASVLTRLKNKAQASGRSYQLCLQLFCQEEFLRRLEKSKYAENFVLKGGLFIYSLTEFDSRVTVDVDFLLRQILIKDFPPSYVIIATVGCTMKYPAGLARTALKCPAFWRNVGYLLMIVPPLLHGLMRKVLCKLQEKVVMSILI